MTDVVVRDADGNRQTVALNADPAKGAKQDEMIAALGTTSDAATGSTGGGSIIAFLRRLRDVLPNSLGQKTKASSLPVVIASDQDALPTSPPLTYTEAGGSPRTLSASWVKAVTTTSATRSLQIGDATQGSYDIFWTVVDAGAAAPSASVKGLPVLAGEDFARGLPIGDVYLRSASGAAATVMVGA